MKPDSARPRGPSADLVATISAGGVVGSLGRYAVGLAAPRPAGGWPTATLLVNVTGAFAMGLLVAYLVSRSDPHRLLRPFVGVGVLGGWTTYSSFAVDVVHLGHEGYPGMAVTYVVGTFVLGVLAVAAAMAVGSRWWPVESP